MRCLGLVVNRFRWISFTLWVLAEAFVRTNTICQLPITVADHERARTFDARHQPAATYDPMLKDLDP